MRDPTVYYLDQLPDDVVSYIFSFLTVRDAFRAKLSSSRWLHLPDYRPVLQFDSHNVLGKRADKDSPASQSKFVKNVNSFFEIWAGKRIHTLVVRFVLGKEHASDIDRWIATSVRKEVEEIEFGVSDNSQDRYVFPSHLIHVEKAPNLKRLCLVSCTLSISLGCTSWLSNLTTLELSNVPLQQKGMDFILSAGSNLISLHLFYCNLPKYVCIDGRLLRLKKLTISEALYEIKLSCPSLEVFEYNGKANSIKFVHVPILREAKFCSASRIGCFSLLFSHLAKQAPVLQSLSLMILNVVKPVILSLVRSNIKELKIVVRGEFDLINVSTLINASPFLETLHIQMIRLTKIIGIQRREPRGRRHLNLKQVKIQGYYEKWTEMELAVYILRNAVALEKMVILIPRDYYSREKVESLRELQKKINPTAQLIIR